MYLRTLLILMLLGALTIFTAVNWTAVIAPTTLSVIFATVQAPLGLILLGTVALLSVLFLLYIAYLQSSVLFESRRHARELQAQRELAEQAEASRYSQLQEFLERELANLIDKSETSKADILARLEQLDHDLRSTVDQSGNSLAAYIGEVDDRLQRAIAK